jgi:hypothetical protein
VRALRKESGLRPDAPPACRGMSCTEACFWVARLSERRPTFRRSRSFRASGRSGRLSRQERCLHRGRIVLRHGATLQGKPWSEGESPKSEKPMGASGRALVATPAGDNGLCIGQPPGVAETDRRIFGLRGKGQNDERGTGSGEPGSDVWVTVFGHTQRGTLRRADVWKRVWRGKQRAIVVGDRLRTRRTPWSAAGCNKPAKR